MNLIRFCTVFILVFCSLTSFGESNFIGRWSGELKVTPQVSLRIVFNFNVNGAGKTVFSIDSPDQNAYGISGEVNYISQDSVSVAVPKLSMTFSGSLANDKINGLFSQGLISRQLVLEKKDHDADRPQTPKPPFPYEMREVTFKNNKANITLSGTLTLPENYNQATTPVVLMVTGSGLQNRDEEIFRHRPFAVIADYLARHGIASLRYDDRGFGKSTGSGNVTTAEFADDAKAGVNLLRNSGKFAHIGVLGHSEGATIAFMLGEKGVADFIVAIGAPAIRGDSISADQSATMLRAANMPEENVADYTNALLRLYDTWIKQGKKAATEEVERECVHWDNSPVMKPLKNNLIKILITNSPWIEYFISTSPQKSIQSTKCPVLVLYGEKDTQVRPEINRSAMKKCSPNADIRIYKDLNHLMQHAQTGAVNEYAIIEETFAPEVIADIADFINKSTDK